MMLEAPMTRDERAVLHEVVVDKGIELTTMGVVASGAATATTEIMHVITGDMLWGHLTGTALGLFYGFVGLNVTFISYRLYKALKAHDKEVRINQQMRLKEVRLDDLMAEVDALKEAMSTTK